MTRGREEGHKRTRMQQLESFQCWTQLDCLHVFIIWFVISVTLLFLKTRKIVFRLRFYNHDSSLTTPVRQSQSTVSNLHSQ